MDRRNHRKALFASQYHESHLIQELQRVVTAAMEHQPHRHRVFRSSAVFDFLRYHFIPSINISSSLGRTSEQASGSLRNAVILEGIHTHKLFDHESISGLIVEECITGTERIRSRIPVAASEVQRIGMQPRQNNWHAHGLNQQVVVAIIDLSRQIDGVGVFYHNLLKRELLVKVALNILHIAVTFGLIDFLILGQGGLGGVYHIYRNNAGDIVDTIHIASDEDHTGKASHIIKSRRDEVVDEGRATIDTDHITIRGATIVGTFGACKRLAIDCDGTA